MRNYYHYIYLSPHLDDAVLSCGGSIATQTAAGRTVLIATLAAGEPDGTELSGFAQSLHASWELVVETVSRRRQEDKAACRRLGADYWHGTLPDCIYRTHPETGDPFYNSVPALFGEVDTAESALIDGLVQQMAAFPPHDQIVVPVTAGNHVDHQLTRIAAERCFGNGLLYYEDYPYVQEVPHAVEKALASQHAAWVSEVIPLNETAIQAKVEAIAAYASQVPGLFGGQARMESQVRHYIAAVGGERFWRRHSSS